MRILIWATALQADILSLAQYLDRETDHELLVVGTGVKTFLKELIAEKRPFQCPLLERSEANTKEQVLAFDADVMVMDNHIPDFKCAKAICHAWHGLGWKARDQKNITRHSEEVLRLTGKTPEESNPYYLAQCYGPHDYDFRINHMHMHPDNCRMVGVPFAELICNPPYSKQELAPRYQIDILKRKTVLVNFTWHYGSISNQTSKPSLLRRLFKSQKPNTKDAQFIKLLCKTINDQNANVLFCMHDRSRYDQSYLAIFDDLEQSFPNRVQIKYKDQHPDNLADLLVADAMVTNLSSFITYFYHTGRPSVHLCPIKKGEKNVTYAKPSRKGVKYKSRTVEESFMTDPEDNGGLTAYSTTECIEHICTALQDPDCCKERSEHWLNSKFPGGIEGSNVRYTAALEELHQRAQEANS